LYGSVCQTGNYYLMCPKVEMLNALDAVRDLSEESLLELLLLPALCEVLHCECFELSIHDIRPVHAICSEENALLGDTICEFPKLREDSSLVLDRVDYSCRYDIL
jgi:hypothetical protein